MEEFCIASCHPCWVEYGVLSMDCVTLSQIVWHCLCHADKVSHCVTLCHSVSLSRPHYITCGPWQPGSAPPSHISHATRHTVTGWMCHQLATLVWLWRGLLSEAAACRASRGLGLVWFGGWSPSRSWGTSARARLLGPATAAASSPSHVAPPPPEHDLSLRPPTAATCPQLIRVRALM